MHREAAPLVAKVVFWGPSGAGKTTNLEHARGRAPAERRGSLYAAASFEPRRRRVSAGAEDAASFDYLTLDLGEVGGAPTRLDLYALPAWVTSLETRRLVLEGADAVVFVADSRPERLEAVRASLAELREALDAPSPAPVVFQWNHRDQPGALPVSVLARELGADAAIAFEAVAAQGQGVMACLRRATELALARRRELGARSSDAVPLPRLASPPSGPGNTLLLAPGPQPTRLMALELPPPEDPRPVVPPAPPCPPVRREVAAALAVAPGARATPAPSPPSAGRACPSAARRQADPPGGGVACSEPAVVTDAGREAAVHEGWDCPWSSSAGDGPPLLAGEDADDPVIGQRVGACRVHKKLGEGGMGAVYLARHEALGKDFVVKVLKPGYAQHSRRVERFMQEARAAARLEHPNVVAVQDVGTNEQGLHYIVMQYVEGKNLFERIRERGPHAPREAAGLVLSVARALEALHAAGVIHRDVKPENVVLTPRGEVKLIDFGLAKDLHAQLNLTAPGAMIGTPVYMAPEIGRVEQIDGRADVYSLGLTFYFLLTGRPPFEGRPLHEVIFARARLLPPERVQPDLPGAYRRVLGKALAWDRRERYPDAGALVRDLLALLAGREPEAQEPSFWLVEDCRGQLPEFPPLVPQASLDQASFELRDGAAAPAPIGPPPRPSPPPAPPSPLPSVSLSPTSLLGATLGERRREALMRAARQAADDPARRAGRWVLLDLLEERSQCRVYRAWDLEREVEVSLHLVEGLPVDRQALEAVRRLSHPQLLPLLDHGHDGQRAWLVAAPLEGRSLKALFNRPGRVGPLLGPLEAARALQDAARALAHALDQGLAHGRIRPGSVWFDARGRGVVVDLPLAALAAASRAGAPHPARRRSGRYVAPEGQAGEAPGGREDVYALGALLYLALTGTAPPQDGPPLPPSQVAPGVLPDLDAITARCLERDPERRYRGPRELARDLERFLQGEPPRARGDRSGPLPVQVERRRERRVLAIAAAALALLLLLLSGRGGAASPPPPPGPAAAGR